MSTVRTHTRQQGGRTVTVHRHERDPNIDQRKRDRLEQRVLRERQQAAHPDAYPARKTPGERTRRSSKAKTRARRHAKKAFKLWRRHKVQATAFAFLALGEITGCGAAWAWRRSASARKAIRASIAKARRGR